MLSVIEHVKPPTISHTCTVSNSFEESLLTSYSAKKPMLLFKHALRITDHKNKIKDKAKEMAHFSWSGPSNTTSSSADLLPHCLVSEYIIPTMEKTEQRVEENNTFTKKYFPMQYSTTKVIFLEEALVWYKTKGPWETHEEGKRQELSIKKLLSRNNYWTESDVRQAHEAWHAHLYRPSSWSTTTEIQISMLQVPGKPQLNKSQPHQHEQLQTGHPYAFLSGSTFSPPASFQNPPIP